MPIEAVVGAVGIFVFALVFIAGMLLFMGWGRADE
jgi:hypothetical protein